jgi:hypothetical protein
MMPNPKPLPPEERKQAFDQWRKLVRLDGEALEQELDRLFPGTERAPLANLSVSTQGPRRRHGCSHPPQSHSR